MMSHTAPIMRFDPKPLTDEYIITNKHIICKFKYLTCCFDGGDGGDDGAGTSQEKKGLIVMNYERFKELMTEQNIVIDSSKSWGQMADVLSQLRTWHPQISRVVADIENPYPIISLKNYSFNWERNQDYFQSLRYNTCVRTEKDLQVFRGQSHIAVDVKVYFKLTRKISTIEKYGINLKYCQRLLADSMKKWSKENASYLDEVSVKKSQLPFMSQPCEEAVCYVYPYLHLVPLWTWT